MKISLFEHCIIVKGKIHSVVQDNLRGVLYRIPKEIVEYFDHASENKLSAYQIEEIEDFLLRKDLGRFAHNLERFPISEKKIYEPFDLEYCIIECSLYVSKYYSKIFSELNTLNCQHLELRFYDQSSLNSLYHVLNLAINTQLRSIDVYYKYNDEESIDVYNHVIEKFPIINRFFVHSVPEGIIDKLKERGFKTYNSVMLSAQVISNNKCCGKIGLDQFCISIDFYNISRKYNTCLYKKISIDQEGYIRNCPGFKSDFGKVSSTNLLSVISNKMYRTYWFISKNEILKCRDCEYRYVCSDCRAYLDDPHNPYSTPLKCGYDPYTGKWSDWSKNPLKEKAILEYNLSSEI